MRLRRRAAPVLALAGVLLAACSNTPPPPVVTSTPPPSPTTDPAAASQIVVGVDDVVGGYNPHTIADSSTITSALSQLLLPSVFRQSDDGTRTLDKTLMNSAEVVSQTPFTVRYEIRPDASWSDGAPIATEDFIYLANAMKSEPGVREPAGYRLISDIEPRDGGKGVEVTFSKPYPAWQTLFDDLLPQHLLKDAPGGWQTALASSFPAVAGPFAIKSLDTARGEVILQRNDRYWEKPAAVDTLALRRSDPSGIATALRSGNDQFSLTHPDSTGLQLLNELGPAVQLHTLPRPLTASVLLRPVSATLSDPQVRAGVAALLNRAELISAGTKGGPSATLKADAQVLPPSAKDYAATIPAGPPAAPDPATADKYFTAAGYKKEAGVWRKNGKTLSLVLASPAGQEPYTAIAKELSAELIAEGIEVNTITPQPRDLFSSMLAMPVVNGQQQAGPDANGNVGVDIAVAGLPVGGDPATVLASTFGCAPGQSTTDKTKPVVPANPTGLCDESLQATIDSALTGSATLADSLKTLEPQLWSANAVIPLFQDAETLAVGKGISGLTPGPPMQGPFGTAVNWTRGASTDPTSSTTPTG
ncbi:ABC transporter family substrate-binding protein [Amycolatopsis jiangsuensis]|uniref:ABC-type transport system substrate-binding protein n=1 Tax=Amycolatopsis jiangsuensis TaxID=1181879 RepID=A0A840J0M2_9PSEU|nr:ABC transporter family substrate-binding protein [Amycolatopsis jiangsuensis]MBB4688516.1 ABC-type transport system substrate-binding protein [Amycolatopsis jiangsuensis]